MRAISIVLVVLLLSACAGTSASRGTQPPGAEWGACGRSGDVAVGPGSSQSLQVADGGLTAVIAAVWLLLGLASAIASCPRAATGADATPG